MRLSPCRSPTDLRSELFSGVIAVVGGELGSPGVGERPPVLATQADQVLLRLVGGCCNRRIRADSLSGL